MHVSRRCLLVFGIVVVSPYGDVVAADITSGLFRGSPLGLRSVPALNTKQWQNMISSKNSVKSVEASIRTKTKRKPRQLPNPRDVVAGAGFYYGISDNLFPTRKQGRKHLSKVVDEAFEELKVMRSEMDSLRRELIAMKRRMGVDVSEDEQHGGVTALVARRKRQRDFDQIGLEVEKWAEKLLFEEGGEEDGWKEVLCNKLVRNKFNKEDKIKCYLKWMTDSRADKANANDKMEYPCVKVYATIDAPMHVVSTYLAQEARVPEYNDLVVKHRDLEEITPHSKVCWGHTPQILFIKPRDLVTFCHHRWLRDGTQVVVNQACDHPEAPGTQKEQDGKFCRAFALRGANFISPDPEDPNKTRMAVLAHANPGGGIPQWGMKTAVGVVAPIEPFKLFHRISENVKRVDPQLERTEMVGSTMHGRSNQPAGLSQMGYACFWPNGGGLKEGILHPSHPDYVDPSDDHHPHHDMEAHHDEANAIVSY